MPFRYRVALTLDAINEPGVSITRYLARDPFGWHTTGADKAMLWDNPEQAEAALRTTKGAFHQYRDTIEQIWEQPRTPSQDIMAVEDAEFFKHLHEAMFTIYQEKRQERYARRLKKMRRKLMGLIEWRMRQVWRTAWDHVRDGNEI